MAIDEYITQTYHVACKGRSPQGREVLVHPVEVKVDVYKSPGSSTISSLVECPYNTGGHGQRCKASHPTVDKLGDGVNCPYSFDIPDALETKNKK